MCQIPKKKIAPYHLHLNHNPLAIFFKISQDFVFSDSFTNEQRDSGASHPSLVNPTIYLERSLEASSPASPDLMSVRLR